MRGSFQPYRAGTGPIGKRVGGSDEAGTLRAFIFGERGPHALGGKSNSRDANVAGQVVIVERGNEVAVVGLWRVGHGDIGLSPSNRASAGGGSGSVAGASP